jgi:hypothetical protein
MPHIECLRGTAQKWHYGGSIQNLEGRLTDSPMVQQTRIPKNRDAHVQLEMRIGKGRTW